MPRPRPPSWWFEDDAFLAVRAAWPCRPQLNAAAARAGVSARVLMLALVADGLARLDVPPRRARDPAWRPARRARTGGAGRQS